MAEGKDCDRADCYELFNVTLRNSLSRVLPNKLTVPQLVTFPVFYGTRRFITVFTTAHHLFLSSTRLFQSAPSNPITLISIVILSSHLHLGLPSGLFPSGFPINTLYAPDHSLVYATCPTHLILLDLITQIIFGEKYRSLSSSLCSFLHSPVTLSLLGPYILLSTILRHPQPMFFLHCKRPVSVLYILISTFVHSKLDNKRFCTKR